MRRYPGVGHDASPRDPDGCVLNNQTHVRNHANTVDCPQHDIIQSIAAAERVIPGGFLVYNNVQNCTVRRGM